jgi:predicted transcriptional regulator
VSETSRRAQGDLEAMVLRCVWAAETPLSPGEVRDAIEADIAYTTAMTVLTRLWEKGLLTREKDGRAYRYRAAVGEADHAAKRMGAVLGAASNREEALSRFVGSLAPTDVAALRRLLDDTAPGGTT